MPRFLSLAFAVCALLKHFANGNQAVSPPPSIYEWLQPFRPIITVSKFPPIIELIAQRIQTQFSNYAYEDLSRPPTYDRPTYKPLTEPSTLKTTTPEAELVIATVTPPRVVLVDRYELTPTTGVSQTVEVEYQLRLVLGDHEEATRADVEHIIERHQLAENATRVFAARSDGVSYEDVSADDASTTFVRRRTHAIKRNLIALTKLHERVYASVIELQQA